MLKIAFSVGVDPISHWHAACVGGGGFNPVATVALVVTKMPAWGEKSHSFFGGLEALTVDFATGMKIGL